MTTDKDGKLAENILLFSRTLRNAGLSVGTGQVIDALVAVTHSGIRSRQDVYWALRCVLVKRPAHLRLFNQAFHLYFRNPRLLERMMGLMLPTVDVDLPAPSRDAAIRRLMEAVATLQPSGSGDLELVLDHSGSWSDREVLREKDFEQMSLDEQREATKLLGEDLVALREQQTRRFKSHPAGERYDLRQSMRLMLRSHGEWIPLAKKRRTKRPPDLVLIADISGSMSAYSRMFLHFAHTLTRQRASVSSFVFGTRLSNITRRMQYRDIDDSMRRIATDVLDWDGGTRIAECLREFNQQWGRRVLARDAIVVLLSDGLERATHSDLEFQAARLHRSCQRLIWMNPMLRYAEFEPLAYGVRKILPHVDDFIPSHNINSLTDMWTILNSTGAGHRDARSGSVG